MTNRRRSVLPALLASAVGMSTAVLMFAHPGDAAPDPGSFGAQASGEVWRVHQLDLDMSGDPMTLDLAVAAVEGKLGQPASPDRADARALNLDASPAPGGQAVAASSASATADTTANTVATGQAGSMSGIEYGASRLTARGRWAGDSTCLPADTALTSSRATSVGSGTVPAPIPVGEPTLPLPEVITELPTEFPSQPPSDFPTDLPTDLPTELPTNTTSPLPTDPTSLLPTDPTSLLPTDPTSLLPTDPTSLLPDPGLRIVAVAPARAAAAEGDVPMVEVAEAQVSERTTLQAGGAGGVHARRVYAEAVGAVAQPSQPVMTFFGGEASLLMAGEPALSAYSTGGPNGSQVTWAAPELTLVVGEETYPVPQDGTALALPYSQNGDVVLTIAAGAVSTAESPDGVLAQADVSVLDVLVKHGDDVALRAELFPMSVRAAAPTGGVNCTPVDTDGDGLTDAREERLGTNKNRKDTDRDRLTDGQEVLKYRTNPLKKDTDRDGLTDGAEVKKHKTKPKKKDTDKDGLSDGREVKKYKTHPRKKDTDGDGVSDGREVKRGTDPKNKRDR